MASDLIEVKRAMIHITHKVVSWKSKQHEASAKWLGYPGSIVYTGFNIAGKNL